MAKRKKHYVKMKCEDCGKINYRLHKSKGVDGDLELKKYCKWCKKHTQHKEA